MTRRVENDTGQWFTLFFTIRSPFSNFYPCSFLERINEDANRKQRFCCVEQFYMYGKAIEFDDDESGRRILNTSNPKAMKAIGRQIKGFNQFKWDKVSEDYMRRALVAKFSQNPDLRRFLFLTHGSQCVECSPGDRIWGVGMSMDDRRVLCPSMWCGKNKLGRIMDEVRDELMELDAFREETEEALRLVALQPGKVFSALPPCPLDSAHSTPSSRSSFAPVKRSFSATARISAADCPSIDSYLIKRRREDNGNSTSTPRIEITVPTRTASAVIRRHRSPIRFASPSISRTERFDEEDDRTRNRNKAAPTKIRVKTAKDKSKEAKTSDEEEKEEETATARSSREKKKRTPSSCPRVDRGSRAESSQQVVPSCDFSPQPNSIRREPREEYEKQSKSPLPKTKSIEKSPVQSQMTMMPSVSLPSTLLSILEPPEKEKESSDKEETAMNCSFRRLGEKEKRRRRTTRERKTCEESPLKEAPQPAAADTPRSSSTLAKKENPSSSRNNERWTGGRSLERRSRSRSGSQSRRESRKNGKEIVKGSPEEMSSRGRDSKRRRSRSKSTQRSRGRRSSNNCQTEETPRRSSERRKRRRSEERVSPTRVPRERPEKKTEDRKETEERRNRRRRNSREENSPQGFSRRRQHSKSPSNEKSTKKRRRSNVQSKSPSHEKEREKRSTSQSPPPRAQQKSAKSHMSNSPLRAVSPRRQPNQVPMDADEDWGKEEIEGSPSPSKADPSSVAPQSPPVERQNARKSSSKKKKKSKKEKRKRLEDAQEPEQVPACQPEERRSL